MPKSPRMEELMEGGFINDRSGKETARLRRQLRVRPRTPKRPGNPTLKKFR